jgi:hypothetical protein
LVYHPTMKPINQIPPELLDDKDWPSRVKTWEMFRRHIEHEDFLINHRMTWLLTMQGLLFTSLALLLPHVLDFWNQPMGWIIFVALGVIAFVGAYVSLLLHVGLKAAKLAIDRLEQEWAEFYGTDLKDFVRICGIGQDKPPLLREEFARQARNKSWNQLPWALGLAWGIILLAILVGLGQWITSYHHSHHAQVTPTAVDDKQF